MKEFNLEDLEWDFSDSDSVVLKMGDVILNIKMEVLDSFIESWNENWE
jgi:hypothetical protein